MGAITSVGAYAVADECGSKATVIECDAINNDSIKKMVNGTVECFEGLASWSTVTLVSEEHDGYGYQPA